MQHIQKHLVLVRDKEGCVVRYRTFFALSHLITAHSLPRPRTLTHPNTPHPSPTPHPPPSHHPPTPPLQPVVPRPDPGAQLQALAPAEDISGTVKETVVRGEDACPSGTLRIVVRGSVGMIINHG